MDAADEQPDPIRDASKSLFGSKYRLETASYLASVDGEVNAMQVKHAIDAPKHNLAIAELRHLVDAGYVEKVPRPRGQREQYYRPKETTYWSLCKAFLDELRAS